MSVSFSAGTGLLIAGVFLLLLIIPGFTDIISDLFNRQVRSVWRNNTRYALAVSGVFLITIGLIIVLKSEIPASPAQQTANPIYTPTSTAFTCNGTIPLSTPLPIIPEPTLVVVMVDGSTTKETIETVLSSLDKSLQAGDRVVVIVSGEQTYDKALVVEEQVQDIAPLHVSPSPSPMPTLTPIPTPKETLSSFQIVAVTQIAREAYAQATQNAIDYSCEVTYWNSSYQASYSQWEAQNRKIVSSAIDSIAQKIQDYGIVKPTSDEVFESIGLVSNIFRTECSDNKFKKCVFVPIAKMVDGRMQQPPSDIQANLTNIEVVGTIADCSPYNQECQDRVNYWTNYLKACNVAFVQFVSLDDLGNLLIDMLTR